MQETRWAQVWMTTGLLWFLLAIAFAPTNKIYQQGLVAFLWLPTLLLAWPARQRFVELWRGQRLVCLAVMGLGVWAMITLLWTQDPDPSRGAKRALYIIVFLLFFPILANARPERVIRIMQWGGLGLAVTALLAAIEFYGVDGNHWMARLVGLGQLAHPILGGYVLGLAAVWLAHWIPPTRGKQLLWLVALAFLSGFVVLSQSRGAALALLLTFVTMPVWCRDRHSRLIALGALLLAMLAFWLLEPLVLARGTSFRPEILRASLDMIAQRPWTGLGMGSGYTVFAEGIQFDHAHNLFTHIAIELGLPGLLLWCVLWFAVLREAWRARDTLYGRGILGIWMFSFLAMQFDAASISGTPRAEWFISWLPVGLATVLVWTQAKFQGCDKIPRST